MTAFFVLPLGPLAYVLHWNRRGWRVSAIHASIVWSCIAIASAEGLSLFHAVNRAVAIMLWISVTIATGALAWRRWRHESRRPELPTFEITPIIAAIAAIAVVTAVLAWFCAPVAWDALTYHLPRVSHWIQNGDLRHYPTHIDRQLWISPGAEYHLLHVELLNGTDRLVNFLQWAALVGCAMNASLIARLLGAGARGQRYAALFAATLSIAAVQASGAQVDLVFSFWLSASVALLLTVTSDWGNSAFWRDVLFLGAAVGLTVVAKSTAYIFGAPFVVWAVLSGVRRNPRRLAGMFAVTILCVVALSAPHSLRNLRTYGHPLHPPDHTSVFNLEVSPRVTASNVLRQTALNFGTHFGRLDTAVFNGVSRAHALLGIGVSDARTTFPKTQFVPVMMSYDEQDAGNPFHLLLIAGSAVALVLFRRGRATMVPLALIAAVVAGFLAYCVYLRWQPWGTRFLMPLFIVAAGSVGFALESVAPRWIAAAAGAGMLVHVTLALMFNPLRPVGKNPALLGMQREKQFFVAVPPTYRLYERVAATVRERRCLEVGIVLGNNNFEHPLWTMLQRDSRGRSEIRHVGVGRSRHIERPRDRSFQPCVIFADSSAEGTTWSPSTAYAEAWSESSMRVYVPATRATP